MKKVTLILVLVLSLALFTACGQREKTYTAEDVAGKVYVYEKNGCGGTFTINLFEDGTFQYYEGMLSSYIGMGTWTVEEHNVLCMKDHEMGRISDDFSTIEMYVRTNYFRVEEDCLVWLAEGSDNFLYVDVEEGDRFFGEPVKLDASAVYSEIEGRPKDLISLDWVRFLSRLGHGYSGEDRVEDLLEGFTYKDLKQYWGEPDGMTSGIWSYAWDLDETSSIWVVFDSEGFVSRVHLSLEE